MDNRGAKFNRCGNCKSERPRSMTVAYTTDWPLHLRTPSRRCRFLCRFLSVLLQLFFRFFVPRYQYVHRCERPLGRSKTASSTILSSTRVVFSYIDAVTHLLLGSIEEDNHTGRRNSFVKERSRANICAYRETCETEKDRFLLIDSEVK